jgi:hypothetical protein
MTGLTPDAQRNQCGWFLKALFDRKPTSTVVMVMQAPRWSEAKAFLSWPPVVEAGFGRPDVYVGCCALHRPPGKGRRGGESEAVLLPAAWADVDVNGGPDGRTGYAPSMEAALDAVSTLAPPTMTVGSGYGIQSWWVLNEPLVMTDAGIQRRAKRIVHGVQRRLAHNSGFKVDNTADLARVLRLPGTLNAKGDTPVDVSIVQSGGPLYSLGALEELGAEFADDEPEHRTERTPGDWLDLIGGSVETGERHEAIWKLAGYLLRKGLDPEVALELVQTFNEARVRPPYPPARVRTLFDGIVRLELKRRQDAGGDYHALRGGTPG